MSDGKVIGVKYSQQYIMTSKRNGSVYTSVTSDLPERIWQHRTDAVEGFTKRYHVHMLVYCEYHPDMNSVIAREKQIKEWKRVSKVYLIEEENPEWIDLAVEMW
jgi:putative endonuclease